MSIFSTAIETLTKAYPTHYKMQLVGPSGNTVRTSIPRNIVESYAKLYGIDVETLIKEYVVAYKYNDSLIILSFVKS